MASRLLIAGSYYLVTKITRIQTKNNYLKSKLKI